MVRPNTYEDFERLFVPEPNSGCWLWLGGSPNGRYGALNMHGRRYLAHVYSFIAHCRALQPGEVIDHLCRNTFCVNPQHLEATSQLENMRRSAPATKTHCVHGHAYVDGVEMYWRPGRRGGIRYRRCLTCYRMRYPGTQKGKR